ncbi:MAG: hypothetical protein ACRD2N_04865 [Vicinamibacterales bacterium]
MTPRLRTLALTAHVTSSVSWLGTIAAFLALALAGLTTRDVQMAQAAYLATELITWYVIVPLAFASLVTGLVVSLGTQWGLFRHHWVLVKFMLTILATVLLLLHTQPIGRLAAIARETRWSSAETSQLQIPLVGDASAALLALLVNVTLSVYKPQGMTAYGRRKHQEERQLSDRDVVRDTERTPRWIQTLTIFVIGLILLFVILHLAGSGLGDLHHG